MDELLQKQQELKLLRASFPKGFVKWNGFLGRCVCVCVGGCWLSLWQFVVEGSASEASLAHENEKWRVEVAGQTAKQHSDIHHRIDEVSAEGTRKYSC
eukprot:65687-Amphidinium_carterae.1